MKQAIHLKISGLVQGVYFRQSTQRKASELGITGWVRNCDDGTVEAFAEGDVSAMKNFLKWCTQGPARAVVAEIESIQKEALNLSGFEIRR